jgi:hypothetical protein
MPKGYIFPFCRLTVFGPARSGKTHLAHALEKKGIGPIRFRADRFQCADREAFNVFDESGKVTAALDALGYKYKQNFGHIEVHLQPRAAG